MSEVRLEDEELKAAVKDMAERWYEARKAADTKRQFEAELKEYIEAHTQAAIDKEREWFETEAIEKMSLILEGLARRHDSTLSQA